jgi:hypothetical protein
MSIVSDDGGASVTLVADTTTGLTAEGPHTVHVTLKENTAATLETGWSQSSIQLSEVAMTSDGRPIYVAAVVDGAEPVVKSVCFAPTGSVDSLRVIFCEPVAKATKPVDEYTVIVITDKNGAVLPLTGTGTTRLLSVTKLGDRFVYVFKASTFTGTETVKAGTRSFPVDLCGDISVVVQSRAINNPFIPGKSVIPASRLGTNDPPNGMRIEVQLVRAIAKDFESQKVRVSFSIFDAVGNTVLKNTEMKEDLRTDSLTAYFIWNGKTQKGGMAAPGTYLVRGLVEDQVRGKKEPFRFYVGIKR